MTTADAVAKLAAASAKLSTVSDDLISLTGEAAALPDGPARGIVDVAHAMALEIEHSTQAVLDAQVLIVAARADISGQPVEPPDPPADVLLWEYEHVTKVTPMDPAGLVAVCGVARFNKPPKPGKYEKLAGASGPGHGGFGLGRNATGETDAWVGHDDEFRQTAPIPIVPAKASFMALTWHPRTATCAIDERVATATYTTDAVLLAGEQGWLLQGWWDGNPVDQADAEWLVVRGYSEQPNLEALRTEWADLIDPEPIAPPVPPGPPHDGLEPIDTSAQQVAVKADVAERQRIEGFGAGFGPRPEIPQVFDRMKKYAKTDFDDIRLKLARIIWSGDGGELGRAYKPMLDWATERVASYGEKLHVHATGFGYKPGDPIGSANRLAASIKAGVDAGCPIHSVCMQNEPGGTDPHWPPSDHVPAHRQMRANLDAAGLHDIVLTGLEYPKDSLDPNNDNCRFHFDQLNGGGLVPSAVAIGGVHVYGDCTTTELADKWGKLGLMQLEAGSGSNPSVGCRMVNDLNKNVRWWSFHLLQAFNADKPGDYGQKLVDMNGNPNAYYRSYQALSTRFLPGTVMRRCTANGAVPHFTKSSKAGTFVAAGKRADGKWVVVGQSNSGARQQLTFQLPEAVSGQLFGARVSGTTASPASYDLVSGATRFTLGSNELIVLIGGA